MKKYNYMLVDDDVAFCILLKEMLKNLTFLNHQGTYNKMESLDTIISENKPDLLLLDYSMDTNDGLSFLAEIEQPPTTIIISSLDDLFLQEFPEYIREFIWKPELKQEELEQKIKKALKIES